MSIQELSSALVEATKSVLEGSKEYQAFFKSALKKFGVDSPAELGDKKKEFFNYVDKNYKGKDEKVEEGKLPPALQKAIDKKKEQEGEKKVDEWISADGDRRRVAEKDSRKVKVEDVVRDMWKNATEV